MFKVGLAAQALHSRYSSTAVVRASYLTAVANWLARLVVLAGR
jgi:hypothetical protein